MAYTKTTWQNNVTDIDANNLNKVEQGIYDNSLVVDAIKDTINPTDTETYKTAELTEGQITDVIGVNDILIKGQTSQNGEPTPSSPVDVNVVSGSNVINIREGKINKNNIIHVYSQGNSTSFVSNPRATSTYFECKPNTTYKILRSEIIQSRAFRVTSSPALEGTYTNYVSGTNVTEMLITSGNQDKYIVVYYHWEGDSEASSDEVLDTLSAYELPGKELPLDLGSIELCKIGDYQDYFYKSGSKWYLHKEIEKVVLDGSESWAKSSNSNVNRYYITGIFINVPQNTNTVDLICNYFKCITQSQSDALNLGLSKLNDTSIMINFALSDTNFDTLAKLKEWLSNSLVKVNYVLKTPTDTEITDTTLISQLESIYNAPLYEETNITQENNDLPMVLDITACKDNINGIKAFIRK